jgi:hypothetical protein
MLTRLQPNAILFTLSLLLIFSSAIGQQGDFILTHHSPRNSEIDNVNFEIKADKNGIICIANRFGVLKYDGREWDFYQTNSSALSMAVSNDNTLYVGCLGEFGKLDYVDNSYQYVRLLETDSLGEHFLQTFEVGDNIYFLSEKNLFSYEPATEKVEKVFSGDFLNGYVNNNQLMINTADSKVLKIAKYKIDTLQDETKLWGIVSASPDGTYEYGVDLDGRLYERKDGQLIEHSKFDKLNQADVVISDLVWVNDSLVACSSIESGVFFLHANDEEYFEVTDYHSGLPDNEIHDIYADNNGGVWVAHEFGLTRIAPVFPASSYTNFPGLEGNLIEAQRIHGDLWVNTSLGVYYFSQDTSYQSRVYVERIRRKTPKTSSSRNSSQKTKPKVDQPEEKEPKEDEPEEKEIEEKKKKGFLRGLFKKKDRAEESQQPDEKQGFFKKIFSSEEAEPVADNDTDDKDDTQTTSQPQSKYQYVRRVEKIVTGISYQFHHVPGTDGKFRQLIETPSGILAASHTGIYEVTKESAQLVINERVRYAFVVPNTNKLLISTEEGILKFYQLVDNIWTEVSAMYFEDVILNVYMDSRQEVWLAGTSHIYQGVFTEDAFDLQHRYEINNRFYDELSIWEHSNTLYFINSQGYFKLERENDRIIADEEIEKELGKPLHHLHNEKSRVWIYNGKYWSLLLPDGSVKDFHYLGVFPNLKYINYDEQMDRYWLVTKDNQLLAYKASDIPDLNKSYSLFVKKLKNNKGEIEVIRNLKLSHNENTLSIELLKPDYLGFLNPEYQYKLVGLNDTWSNWTNANLIDYSYIPPGDYQLHVKVRDALGFVEETTVLTLNVETPYWQQPWFYASQVFILALIMWLTSRLDESRTLNWIIKHGLTILTLVIIIEFLQAVIGSYLNIKSTPVVDFLIQAGIAFVIFPLEWLLKRLILDGRLTLRGRRGQVSTEEAK